MKILKNTNQKELKKEVKKKSLKNEDNEDNIPKPFSHEVLTLIKDMKKSNNTPKKIQCDLQKYHKINITQQEIRDIRDIRDIK